MFTVYGIIDYWPGWSPLPADRERGENVVQAESDRRQLEHIQNMLALEPYEVWLKLKDGVGSQSIYDELTAAEIQLTGLQDAIQQLITSKNDPFRMAINGVMTLGFVISMLISFFGFLLFWVLALSGRTLQYRHSSGNGHLVPANYRHAAQRAAAHLRRSGYHRCTDRQYDQRAVRAACSSCRSTRWRTGSAIRDCLSAQRLCAAVQHRRPDADDRSAHSRHTGFRG